MGIIIIATIGLIYFKESLSLLKILAIVLIIIGVVVLNLTEGKKPAESQSTVVQEQNQ
ncbi:multidrug efflux system protein MdtJ [compost metagenome]